MIGSNDWWFLIKERSKGKFMMILLVLVNFLLLIVIGKGDGKIGKIESEMFMLKCLSLVLNCFYKWVKVIK